MNDNNAQMEMTLDTLNITKRLRNQGAEQGFSEELSEIMQDAQQDLLSKVATKEDLTIAKKDLRAEMSAVRNDLSTEILAVKNDVALVRKEINIAMYKSIIAIGAVVALIEKFIN